jgi:hypothetical protein
LSHTLINELISCLYHIIQNRFFRNKKTFFSNIYIFKKKIDKKSYFLELFFQIVIQILWIRLFEKVHTYIHTTNKIQFWAKDFFFIHFK